MRIERAWAMPSKNTFSIKPIGAFIQEEMGGGLWIDPFSCGCRIAQVTNDLNPDVDADYHMDALDFLKQFEDESVDGVLYDPPYSSRQVAECYHGVGREVTMETTQGSFWAKHKREMARIVKRGGAGALLRVEQRRRRQEVRIRDDPRATGRARRRSPRHHLHVGVQTGAGADCAGTVRWWQ